MKINKTKKIVGLAMLLCLSVTVGILESFVSLPIPVPGIKLGLANFINLFVLYYYDLKSYFTVGFLRVVLSALLFGGFGIGFVFSICVWTLSAAAVSLAFLLEKFSVYGLSTLGAALHQTGQISAAILIYRQIGFLYYLPILLSVSTVTGGTIAFLTVCIIRPLNKSIKKQQI